MYLLCTDINTLSPPPFFNFNIHILSRSNRDYISNLCSKCQLFRTSSISLFNNFLNLRFSSVFINNFIVSKVVFTNFTSTSCSCLLKDILCWITLKFNSRSAILCPPKVGHSV
uniref:Uncharacterized protein n=1 Tax=Cacopsylla melanoneura TaxID=428564 RepID=A0A8D8XH86_9HEMI